jgi:type IV pilus assembly protein PilQ
MRWLVIVAIVALGALPAWARPYHGKKITIDLQDAEIANVIRLIGDVSGKNIIFGDDVKGKVTIKLKDVPWDQALDVILKTHGLGSEENDNVIYVAPQAVLDDEEQKRLDAAAKHAQTGPLTTRIIPLNFANAKEMADRVRPLLSPRGSVVVDERTNSLIVRDVRGSGALSF